jgi:hypothetical protein
MVAACFCAALTGPATAAQVIYANDFEVNADGFNVSGRGLLPTTASGFGSGPESLFLGRFGGNESSTLSLTGLTAGQRYIVGFDLFIGRSWDGNSTNFGPDRWTLALEGGEFLVNTSFLNLVEGVNSGLSVYSQDYSDSTPVAASPNSGTHAPFTGADVAYIGNASDVYNRYSIYYFSHGAGNPVLSFTASSSTANLIFAGQGLQEPGDEFWSIDNVQVTVPEPGSLALLSMGLMPLVGAQMRRKHAQSA